jgi:glycosyltransferase involved in cell wall biosynthesis
LISVIIPSYESHATVRATLESLRRQTFCDFETILVDSGQSDAVARIAADFPEVRYHRATQRCLPHEARNVGVALTRSDLIVFTDPDIIAASDWIEKLLQRYRACSQQPVAGAVACVQKNWLSLGIHVAKFDLWLPGGKPRTVPLAATVNFLCPRHLLEQVDGFDGREMIGDAILSWELKRRGCVLHFAPDAIVYHDHRSSFADLLRERFVRGADFARLRMESESWNLARTFAIFLATIFPLRLVKLLARVFTGCLRAGQTFDFIRTLPIVAAGHASWLGGESTQYWRRLHPLRTSHQTKRACVS